MNIGLLGGTFDPIHNGHVHLAKEAIIQLNLEKVLFIPAFLPPHKDPSSITDIKYRMAMLKLVIEHEKQCEICTIEADKKEVCYTVDTLRKLKGIYSENTHFFFLVGSDFVHEYQSWKEPESLVKLATCAIAARPGFSVHAVPDGMVLLEGDFPLISSRDVRIIVRNRQSATGLAPKTVLQYITEHGLYR